MRVYTRTGDDGTTGLYNGERRPKTDPIFDVMGTLDELNSSLGLAAVVADDVLRARLALAQGHIFELGGELASGGSSPATMINEEAILELEQAMDAAMASLPVLRHFVLPGGTELAARLHVARTVCRRAERHLLGYQQVGTLRTEPTVYLNRLSDWLFVAARAANAHVNHPETLWPPNSI